MKILLVNTSDRTGGAAVAAHRLMDALNCNGEKARMLVLKKTSNNISVLDIGSKYLQRLRFLWERLRIFIALRGNKENLFKIDPGFVGNDITKLKAFREADVIHLHWVNQGMLSLSDIRKILATGKPVVWTMHDAWASTAICHITSGCKAYTTECRFCKLLPNNGAADDLSNKVWKKKKMMLKDRDVTFVACSRWLENQVKQSSLLKDHHITNIPNCIDTNIYRSANKAEARERLSLPNDKRLLLFVAHKVEEDIKGVNYLLDAIELLLKQNPDWKDTMGVILLGNQTDELKERISLPVYPMGYVDKDKTIVDIYNSADTCIVPSLEDNLPNIVMEAMACGVPCVGFRTGGIPEMIDHFKNGYVAEQRNTTDLATGIKWVLNNPDKEKLSKNATRKVVSKYSQHTVALQYIEVYNHAAAFKRYLL